MPEIPNNAPLISPIGSLTSDTSPILERDIVFADFASLADEQQGIVASWLRQRTSEVNNMLNVEEDDVRKKHLGIVAMKAIVTADEQTSYAIVGYIGATQPEEHRGEQMSEEHEGEQMSEVGSLYVEKAHRKHEVMIDTIDEATGEIITKPMRISMALAYYATKMLEEQGIIAYAFCNEGSYPIFNELGFKESSLSAVPPKAGELCKADCKLYQACHPDDCCDTIMVKDLPKSKK
ncbi:MAG: hypothetical protein Q4A37_02395 [Candidatus Saccharibacteria bacterium]|nr:hypothetical protein [Candidatus Saccharibacteria bacterium]